MGLPHPDVAQSSEPAQPVQKIAFKVVLLRHGESPWNAQNCFTGWTDVGLSEQGCQEARQAGAALTAAGYTFDLAYTSVLRRAISSLWLVLEAMQLEWLPVIKDWRLNERHYGALQGLNKAETAVRLGQRRVFEWRRSYAGRPPRLEWDDARHPRFDRRYAALPPQVLPAGESLADTVQRLLPCWQEHIAPAIRSGQQVLIVAHGNSLRALAAYLDQVPETDVPGIVIPTGVPLVYELDERLAPVRHYPLEQPGASAGAVPPQPW